MDAATASAAENVFPMTGPAGPKGRKDSEGQEQVIKDGPVRDERVRLLKLREEKDAATEAYNAAVKAVAEQAGLLASSVRKYINTLANDTFEDEKRKCQQLQFLFDQLGDGKGNTSGPALDGTH